MSKILFVSDQNYLDAPIKGGVQICTAEYLDLFQKTNCEILLFPIKNTRNYWKRLLIKLGLNVFHHYDYIKIASSIAQVLREQDIQIVALNQVNLLPLAKLIKGKIAAIRTIVLSHGNESGDFLHEVVRSSNHQDWIKQFRLGSLLRAESSYYRSVVDLVLCLSKEEVYINQWLGAHNCLFIPRVFNPTPLNWEPELGLVGFVGTLNHAPNLEGIRKVCDALHTLKTKVKLEIVGNGTTEGRALAQDYPFVEYLGALDNGALKNRAKHWAFFLNPVFHLSRGASTKLATGINWGLPIVSTLFGNRGYQWKEGEIVTIQRPDEMARFLEETSFIPNKLSAIREEVLRVANSGLSIIELAQLVEDNIQQVR